MSERSESPFFPVPVRWFEIPMNTVRWGFARATDGNEARPKFSAVSGPVPDAGLAPVEANAEDPDGSPRVGRLLNVQV
jgi:hypothetical protein